MNLPALLALYQACNLRERLLIGVTLLVLVWGIWIASFGGMLGDKRLQQNAVLTSLQQQMQAQNDQLALMQSHSRNGVVARLKGERDQLDAELQLMEQEVALLLGKFVPADEIPLLLEDVLSNYAGLSLTAIRSRPSQKVTLQMQQADQTASAALEIYRHPIQIEFSGRYADVAAYVNDLEQGDWQFAWRSLEYRVEEYPIGKVLLEVETLSQEKEWLGV